MGKVLKLGEMIEGYRLFAGRKGEAKSIRWYMHKLHIFERYLRSQDFPLEVGKITTEHLRRFLVHPRESVKADELNPHNQRVCTGFEGFLPLGNSREANRGESLASRNDHPHQEHSHPLLFSPAVFPRDRYMISVTVVV